MGIEKKLKLWLKVVTAVMMMHDNAGSLSFTKLVNESILESLKDEDRMCFIAHDLTMTSKELGEIQKTSLSQIFHASLTRDPAKRYMNLKVLWGVLPTNDALGGATQVGSQIHFTEGIVESNNLIPKPVTMTPYCESFQISKSIFQLYEADYRVRQQTFNSILSRAQDSSSFESKLGLQVALCFDIGFGTEPNEKKRDQSKTRIYLPKARVFTGL
ncbi:hypothetical protein G7Y89_g8724 [Cudoniella acicularis]|uniref:Uncharacterized protein n=1 Tax=Cudoniella acicularis TaxID=354080 RepID=A0A8H4W0B9_9HELO|nr:hypothetical protein G7Y89_g8724 [Cudoniella acicularis]